MKDTASQLKVKKYQVLLQQAKALTENESDIIANYANISALINDHFSWWWIGFYIVKGEELVLGPFQGPVACTRIKFGKGVCGTAWKNAGTIVVADVDKFPGHIACSELSRSEIVVPVFGKDKVIAVLDIDSAELNSFNDIDKAYLEELVKLL